MLTRTLMLLGMIAPVLAGPPLPDRDGDRRITALDYRLFQTEFAARLPGGDANGDGAWNVLDFSAYINNVAAYEDAGWSPITADPSLRWVHVDSQTGSDTGSGTPLAPLRTVEAAQARGFDVMALRAGRTWDCVRTIHLSQDRGPTWIVPWGEGARPELRFTDRGAIDLHGSDVTIIGITLTCSGLVTDELAQCGISGVGFSQPMSRVLIEDCLIRGWFKGIVADAFTAPAARDWRVRRCVIADCYQTGQAHTAGAYFAGIDGLLLEENVLDHNGWREDIPAARPNIFRRNLYIQSNCTGVELRGNIFARSGAEGFQMRSGGRAIRNLSLMNSVSAGYLGGPWAEALDNVALDSRDLDAANPRGGGWDLSSMTDGEVARCIAAHRSTPGDFGIWGFGGGTGAVYVHDCLVYNWTWAGAGVAYAPGGPIAFKRNRAVQDGGGQGFQVPSPAEWTPGLASANAYWTVPDRVCWLPWMSRTGTAGDLDAIVHQSAPVYNAGTAPRVPTIGDYAASLGLNPTLDAFLAAARQQSYAKWRPALTGTDATRWFQERAGIAPESR